MSRLIVKNLPKDIKEDRFRSVFSSKGEITDVRLCTTQEGKFRRFGFVGFKTVEEAENAMKYFNDSYIDTCRIQIEVARNLGEKTASRPWSRYSEGSSAYQKIAREKSERSKKEKDDCLVKINDTEESKSLKKKDKKKKEKKDLQNELNEMEQDPEFVEFLQAHEHRNKKSLCSNDSVVLSSNRQDTANQKCENTIGGKESVSSTEEHIDDVDDESALDKGDSDHEENTKLSKNATNLSDMDYLKSKIVSKGDDVEDKNSDKSDKDDDSSSDESESNDDESESEETHPTPGISKQNSEPVQSQWTIKMRGLPFKAKDKHIVEFFSPIKCVSIRFVKNNKGQPSGRAFVDFQSKEDLEKALKRDKDYLEGRYIELFRDDSKRLEGNQSEQQEEKPWVKKLKESSNDEEDESIGESGRLFLRNLAYTCTEDDLQKLFEEHGPLSEVNLPLDKVTNKPIGIGYVTFLMPEHAVKAFNELDGHVFQGRLLHILPSKARKTEDNITVDSSYKKKTEAQKKAQSSSDHNWNTLFLGVNAVADAMADKYNTTKRGILDAESSNSLAVRMALGETQVVADTRKFLVENGVKLDVFGQPASQRSKTVIVAKNLPYGTSTDDLKTIFSPFGQLQRIVLPPTGITALVEFQEPSIARKAFQKLAYTKFKNSLLYLEWSPMDVFVEASHEQDTKTDSREDEDEDISGDESDTEQQDGKTLFVKNLNFETTEEVLKEKFSQVGSIKSVTVARKKDSKNQGALLSMGYGFVEFKKKPSALKALKELQRCMVDNHALELKISHRKSSDKVTKRQRASTSKQKTSKILVRNVPFEATSKELRELFSTFGEIKTLRLPKKMVGTGPHRGFAFVDFLTKQDAKRAFEALSTSTHLYGRRLVLEWADEEDDVDTLRKRTAKHFQESTLKTKKKKEMMDELSGMTAES